MPSDGHNIKPAVPLTAQEQRDLDLIAARLSSEGFDLSPQQPKLGRWKPRRGFRQVWLTRWREDRFMTTVVSIACVVALVGAVLSFVL
jgi:hypothetical protein